MLLQLDLEMTDPSSESQVKGKLVFLCVCVGVWDVCVCVWRASVLVSVCVDKDAMGWQLKHVKSAFMCMLCVCAW